MILILFLFRKQQVDQTVIEMEKFLDEVFPQIKGRFKIINLSDEGSLVEMKVKNSDLRPGGTVSGPSMFSLADICFYVAVLHTIGLEALAVTTNCSINFLRKPDPKILYGRARIFKKGKSLIVGDVEILGEDRKIIVAHASMTYSCPPTKM